MDMRDINFVSGGRNPNCEPVCRTCSFRIVDKENSDWGWCPIIKIVVFLPQVDVISIQVKRRQNDSRRND